MITVVNMVFVKLTFILCLAVGIWVLLRVRIKGLDPVLWSVRIVAAIGFGALVVRELFQIFEIIERGVAIL